MTNSAGEEGDRTLLPPLGIPLDQEVAREPALQVTAVGRARAPRESKAARSIRAAEAVRELLSAHGLSEASAEHAVALADTVRRLWETKPMLSRALVSRDRQQATACTRALLRHAVKPPKRAGTTEDRRRKLIARIDSLHAVVKLAAASGFNVAPVIDRLRADNYTAEDLHALNLALESIPPGHGAGPPAAPYLRLLRGGVLVWESCGRTERYTLNDYTDPPTLEGPLPAFLRALIELAELAAPNDNALHSHLVRLKNL